MDPAHGHFTERRPEALAALPVCAGTPCCCPPQAGAGADRHACSSPCVFCVFGRVDLGQELPWALPSGPALSCVIRLARTQGQDQRRRDTGLFSDRKGGC